MIDTDATTCDDVLVAESSLQAHAAPPLARRLDRILAALRPTPAAASVQAARRQRRLDDALLVAVRRLDTGAVADVLAQGADANAIRRRYRTVIRLGRVPDAHDSALLLALKSHRLPAIDVALLLLEHGADAAYVNRHGETARSVLSGLQTVVDEAFGEAGRSLGWRLLSVRLNGRR